MSRSEGTAILRQTRWLRLLRDRRIHAVASLLALGYLGVRWALLLVSDDPLKAADAFTYWNVPYDDPYAGPRLGVPGAYLYTPAFLQVIAPLRLLPWEVFHAVWALLGLGSMVFLVGPIGGAIALTVLSFVARDILVGNIHLMLGAAIVIGLRHPAAWAFAALTKVTPGVGLAWFIGRREWRRAGIALGVTALIAGASFAITPDLWFAWVDRMRGDAQTAGDPYLLIIVVRATLAAALVVYAGWRNQAWIVPIAVVLALPVLWPDSLAILLACFPLLRLRVAS
ncbi:MAG: DUF2029 domain-containing protein [Chloroflexi bacterium]|nr:DUF2029 domain-containing protein [Chloroflexota bacterium]